MINNNNQEAFIETFKNNLKKDARTVSVATLLSDRYLKRIKYDPYYQRNYVWEKDKQSFFIESVVLGTEIPPLVFYKSGMRVEVIDGRQRFETLKRFKEDDFALHLSGLLELQALAKKTFSKLNSDIQQLFLNTKIRIFEFEVVGMPVLDPVIEDKIKKEIFRRYNSGITPLNQSEVDNAKYDSDTFSDYFKHELKENEDLYNKINKCFFYNSDKIKNELIVDMVTFLRKSLILSSLPITRYADSGKNFFLDLLYDNYIGNARENEQCIEDDIKKMLEQIHDITAYIEISSGNAYECLLWGIRILNNENIPFDISKHAQILNEHYKNNLHIYQTDSDHYYGNIVARFTDTANLLNKLSGFEFKMYLRSSDFKHKINSLKQTEKDAELTMDRLASLRINKPSPASKPIDQVMADLASYYYLIRPSYQRQEKISIKKASSIIESILLGIKLPPLFIYVRKDGIREVIDGQQRLLSIIGFLGRSYINEEGIKVHSINHNFKLKELRILKHYNGKRYSDILSEVEDTILDFDLDEIEISQDLNEDFEATDLFIRLNSKPYPIKPNTFEMWNSIVDKDVIQLIREITAKYVSWFYIKAPDDSEDTRKDRMQNEELITILSYLCYNNIKTGDITRVLGFYPRMEKFTCRLKTKYSLTDLLESFEFKPTEKELFLKSINKTESIIKLIKDVLLEDNATKESFNAILNIKNLQRFSRSYQEFYILWIMLYDLSIQSAMVHKTDIINDLRNMFSLLKNIDDKTVDTEYVEQFLSKLKSLGEKYKKFSTQ